jgi:hypothetical protein
MVGVEHVRTCNLTTHVGDSAEENIAASARTHHLGRPNHSIYRANNFPPASGQDDLGACLGSQNSHAVPENGHGHGIGEINAIDPDQFLVELPDVSPDDTWYNLSFGDEGLEQYAGFEPLALFQQGWRVFN